jgi:Family of unknown function (DUF6399)
MSHSISGRLTPPTAAMGSPHGARRGPLPWAAQQRAAAQALRTAEETRSRGPPPPQRTGPPPARRGPGRPPKAAPGLEPATPAGAAARQESPRLAPSREQMRQSLRAMGPASPCVALARGIRRHGTRIARYPTAPRDDPYSCPAGTAQRGVPGASRASRAGGPNMPAPIACVSGAVRRQGSQLALAPPASSARPAPRIPASSLERLAATSTLTAGTPLRALAEGRRPPRCAPAGGVGALRPVEQHTLPGAAAKRAAGFQRSRATVEGRNGSLSFRRHQLRGLAHPRKRAGLTAVHHCFLTRPDGTTAAERCFGQKPRAMCAAIFAAVEIPPAPLRPPRRAVG